jgi:hypothetical protein
MNVDGYRFSRYAGGFFGIKTGAGCAAGGIIGCGCAIGICTGTGGGATMGARGIITGTRGMTGMPRVTGTGCTIGIVRTTGTDRTIGAAPRIVMIRPSGVRVTTVTG